MKLDSIKVRTEMFKQDLTQIEMAKRTGFSRMTIGRICNGGSCNTSTAKAIAEALGATVEDLA